MHTAPQGGCNPRGHAAEPFGFHPAYAQPIRFFAHEKRGRSPFFPSNREGYFAVPISPFSQRDSLLAKAPAMVERLASGSASGSGSTPALMNSWL